MRYDTELSRKKRIFHYRRFRTYVNRLLTYIWPSDLQKTELPPIWRKIYISRTAPLFPTKFTCVESNYFGALSRLHQLEHLNFDQYDLFKLLIWFRYLKESVKRFVYGRYECFVEQLQSWGTLQREGVEFGVVCT